MNSLVLSVKFSDASAHFSKHYHDCHEMFYVTSGKAKISVGNAEYSVGKGTLIIISRYEKHSVTVESDDYKRYTVRISPELFNENTRDYMLYSVLTNRPESFTHAVKVCEMHGVFEELFSKLKEEYDKSDSYGNDMLDMYLKQILVHLFRHSPEMFSNPDNQSLSIVGELQSRFQKNCKEKYTLESLSKEYNISTFYLSHLFKRVTGYSVMNYLLSCRIANAKKLLANTDMDIGEICHRCGFSDSSNFSRMFKNETGFTPTAFRKS